ncbi:MAG: non-ribosomal peptide synthetase, partial [Romboutsia sp.]|nr:non-ribosomal peptide synthetase [Romboutsia sp.]
RNDLVGVAVDRSFEMMVAIIAVLKAGGAFVPLDPNYPEERLELIIHDTCLSTIIIDKSFIGKISTVPIKKVSIDKDQALIDLESDIDPIHINTPEDLAYIIYTSGSTGTPKGVMIEHQALSNLLYGNKSNMLSVDETTVIASFSSVNFDAFIWEWSCVLVKGGTLVLLSGLDTIVEDKISCFIEDHKINYLSTTASILNLLPISIAKQLRTLAIFGDTSKYEVVKKWCEYTNVYNGYGPTENSITSTIFQCNKNLRNILPIGKPITNVKIYILDNYLKLVPIGVYGEIYIGGRGLARGYLNRKDLTTEKFIDNPFRDRNSQNNYDLKLYKTGDLGRYLEDGNIDFLGRTDSQVKVRGFRVELSEIEYHLLNHELIKDSIVVMKKNNLDPENKLLLAYIVPINIDNFKVRSTLKLPNKKKIKILTINKSSKIGNNDIKKYLRSKMPEFMIPNHFIFLNKIPLTINGKIDRAYLASLSLFKEKLDKSGYLAPSNIIQQKICRIFSEVLGLKDKENIGILDNFFQLGGDSIAAMKLVGILKKEFKADIAMTDIFLCQTPQKLWEKIFFKEKQQENIIEIKSIENSFGGEFSLLPIQSWFFS